MILIAHLPSLIIGSIDALSAADSSRWVQQLGRMHIAIVHFPIALLLVAGFIEFARALVRKQKPSSAAVVCLSIGAVSAAIAAVAGWVHRDFTSYGGSIVLQRHQWIGIAAAIVAILTLIPLLLHSEKRRWPLWSYRAGAIIGALLVAITGHLGGTLTYGEGYLTELIFNPPAKPQADGSGVTPAMSVDMPKIADISTVKWPADGKINFERDVQPILAHSCFSCHGPEVRRGELRVDNKEATFQGGNSGPSVIAHDPEKSPLLRRVLGLDDLKQMPLKADPLPEAHVKILRAWIEQGAVWPDHASIEGGKEEIHWAYVKPDHPSLPTVSDTNWPKNGIDNFILARLDKEGMKPSPEADRATLIRRVSLDLTGLPPTPEEVDAFVADNRPSAYDELVNRLLASPHYGERWGRHWLDIARYADTNGYEKDNPRIIWPYRDWVINALNRDVTFDQFVIKQLAGDMLPNASTEDIIATGFHRNTMFNEEGGIDAEEFRFKNIVDRVQTTSTAFLGLTMQCAQCHNHKYDKLSHEEYYKFFAFFNNADEPEFKIPSNEVSLQHANIDAQVIAAEAALESQFPTHEDVIEFKPIEPTKLTAASGAVFTKQADGSYLVGGNEVPATDVYTAEIATEFANLIGLKIETLIDASLPKNGSGRAKNGNFAVTELKATATVSASGQIVPLMLVAPQADFSQPNWEVEKSLDNNPETGWAGSDGSDVPKGRFATYRFKDPLPAGAGTITLVIEQAHPNHSLGRFRLSLTSIQPQPATTQPVEQLRAAFLAAKMDAWEKQAATKATNWTILDPAKFTRFHDATMTELPDKSVLITGDAYYRDQYQFQFDTDQRGITGIRLEVLPHEALPNQGPARGKTGGGLLSEFTVTTLPLRKLEEPDLKPTPIALQNPTADASPETVARAIDEKLDTHWSVPGGDTRTVVFQVKDGAKVGGESGTRLGINLDSNYHQTESLGRVRFSITTDEKAAEASGLPAEIESIILTAKAQRTPDQLAKLKRHFLLTTPLLAEPQRQIAALRASKLPNQTTLVMQERAVPRVTKIYHRGEFFQPREAIDHAAVPAVLPQIPEGAPLNRLTLARWLVSEENPLLARVTINRIWTHYFGRGVVNTVEDFGMMGEKPSHPELLDWLATEFQRQDWSMKALHRLIVTSATYKQTSVITDEGAEKDPPNVLLARGPRVRVEAETVRDIALAASGLLNEKLGGPSVFPPQPAGVSELSYGPLAWKVSVGPDRYRRGMYTFIKRTALYPGLGTFDAPSSEVVCARRNISNTPLQALTTLNDEVFVEAAQAMALRVVEESPDTESRLERMFRLCVAREPDETELAAVKAFYEKQLERFKTDKAADVAAIASLDPAKAASIELPSGMDLPQLAAMTVTARSVLNLDETITKE